MMAMRNGPALPVGTPCRPRYAAIRDKPPAFAPISGGSRGSSGARLERSRAATRDAAERAVEGVRRAEAGAIADLVDGPVGRDQQPLSVRDPQADHVLPEADAARLTEDGHRVARVQPDGARDRADVDRIGIVLAEEARDLLDLPPCLPRRHVTLGRPPLR